MSATQHRHSLALPAAGGCRSWAVPCTLESLTEDAIAAERGQFARGAHTPPHHRNSNSGGLSGLLGRLLPTAQAKEAGGAPRQRCRIAPVFMFEIVGDDLAIEEEAAAAKHNATRNSRSNSSSSEEPMHAKPAGPPVNTHRDDIHVSPTAAAAAHEEEEETSVSEDEGSIVAGGDEREKGDEKKDSGSAVTLVGVRSHHTAAASLVYHQNNFSNGNCFARRYRL